MITIHSTTFVLIILFIIIDWVLCNVNEENISFKQNVYFSTILTFVIFILAYILPYGIEFLGNYIRVV